MDDIGGAFLPDLFGEKKKPDGGKLAQDFLIPPFSVLNAREGYWQERKRAWVSLGIKSELGRTATTYAIGDKEKWERNITPGGGGKNSVMRDPKYRGASSYNKGLSGGSQNIPGTEEEHPGTSIFDPVLCELAYRWFCPPGGVVLDPFAGGSVRGIVASRLGYEYHGVELRDEQIKANRDQALDICGDPMPLWHHGDARGVADIFTGKADFIFTCPPYGDLEVYSDDPRDLSTLGYAEFIEAYSEIITASVGCLNDDRFACVVVGDFRKNGVYVGFPWDTYAAFIKAGTKLYNEGILITAVGSLPVRTGKQFSSGRKLGKSHQNILVFVKGDWRRAAAFINGG